VGKRRFTKAQGLEPTLKLSLTLWDSKLYSAIAKDHHPAVAGRSIGMDTFPDLGSLTDQELKDLIKQLTEEEMEISYRRRILHGKIDILRAELVNRLRKKDETGDLVISGADVQQLTDILAGRVPASDPE
jgi:hypothetical protein